MILMEKYVCIMYHVCVCEHVFVVLQFCRSHPALSQYESYLQYTKTIGEEMGFVVCEDQLRIPSSKKVFLSVPFYCLF